MSGSKSHRAQEMVNEANRLAEAFSGLTFEGYDQNLVEMMETFDLPKSGKVQEVRNVLSLDVDGVSLKICDLALLESNVSLHDGLGDDYAEKRVTVGFIDLPQMPSFRLELESMFDKVAAFLGGQDIDFEDSAEFSNEYRLRGEDEGSVRALFNQRRRKFVLDSQLSYIQSKSGNLVFSFGGEVSVSKVEVLLRLGVEMRTLFDLSHLD